MELNNVLIGDGKGMLISEGKELPWMHLLGMFFAVKLLIKSALFVVPRNFALNSKYALKKLLLILICLTPISAFANFEHPIIDSVVVEKAQRKMYLISDGVKYREFSVSLGDRPIGHKQRRGDQRTPEGKYTIGFRNSNSRYHLSLRISYPNAQDKGKANALGVHPGGNIAIHGLPNGMGGEPAAFRNRDWTNGCIAVTNEEIKEIWLLVKHGTAIDIRP